MDLDIDIQKWSKELVRDLPTVNGVDKLPSLYFVGKAGSGKSYCSKFMTDKYGYTVAKFAYPIYLIAEKYFNMQGKDRRLLQVLGTEAGRETINQDIWVNRFKEDMRMISTTTDILSMQPIKFVMDDCRFPNEHKILTELGFKGIYLNVPDKLRKQRLVGRDGKTQEDTFNHTSETSIDLFKHNLIQLDASGDLEDMYLKINNMLFTLRGV